jgi:hypothetical protein
MFYKAKVAVWSEIRTKHVNAMWAPRRIFECYSWWYVKLPLGFKRLIRITGVILYAVLFLHNRISRTINGDLLCGPSYVSSSFTYDKHVKE